MNSAGSATKENEIYMESIEGKLKQLESAWQQFATNTIDGTVVKSLVNLGTHLIEFADTNVGKFILSSTMAAIAISKLSVGFGILKTAILSNGQALFASLLMMQGVPAASAVASASTLGLAGSIKILTAALLTNPLFWGGAAIASILAVTDAIKNFNEEQRKTQATLADTNKTAAEELETLKKKYETLTNAEKLTAKQTEELTEVTETLADKYNISKEALDKENQTREGVIKKINEEITARKQAAAAAETQSVDFKGGERESLESETGIAYSSETVRSFSDMWSKYITNRSDALEVEGQTLSEVQKQMEKYISVQSRKKDLTESERKTLEKVTSDYTDLTNKIDIWKKGYAQAYENVSEGIMITNEEATALKKLGMITGETVAWVKLYNGAKDEEKERIEKGFKARQNQIKQQEEEKKTIELANRAEQGYIDNKFLGVDLTNNLIDTSKEYSDVLGALKNNLDMVNDAYAEQNENGGLSIDTIQKLIASDADYLNYLVIEDGQVRLTANAFEEMTKKKLNDAIANLELQKNDIQQKLINEGKAALDAAGEFYILADAKAAAAKEDGEALEDLDKKQAILEKLKKDVSSITPGKSGGGSTYKYTPKTSKSTATKTQKEEYKATIDTLYNYNNALEIAKEKVDKLQDSLSNTKNLTEQEKYTRQLIDAINMQIQKTQDLKNAQTNQINDYINQLRAQGFAIDYNNQTNELYINNMQHLADFSGDTAKSLEKLINNIQDLNKDNVSLDSSIRDLTQDTKDYYDQLGDFPEQRLEKFKELMSAFQESQMSAIENQITDLEHAMANDEHLKALQQQLDLLEEQSDEVDRQKDMEEKLLAVEKAKIALENAQKQKTLQVYSAEASGFVWMTDPDTISEAQQNLEDAQKDLNDKVLEDKKQALKDEIAAIEDNYQTQIDALQKFLDEQDYLIEVSSRETIQTFDELKKAMAEYGINSAQYLKQATDWLNKYNSVLSKVDTTTKNIATQNNGVLYSSDVQGRINSALSSIMPNVSSSGVTLKGVSYTPTTGSSGQNIYIDTIQLPNVKDSNDFIEALKILPTLASSQSTIRK